MTKKYLIKDWAGNVKFEAAQFDSFDLANDFLTEFICKQNPELEKEENEENLFEELGEFFIDEIESV